MRSVASTQAAISRMDGLNPLISVLGKSTGALSLCSPHLPLASIAACTPYPPLCPPLCSCCPPCTCTFCLSLSCLLTSCCVIVSYLSDYATLRSFLFTRSTRWMPKYSKHCGSPFILLPSFSPFFIFTFFFLL